MLKSRFWAVCLAVLFLLSLAVMVWTMARPASGTVANVYLDGVCVHSVDLDRVRGEERFTLEGTEGNNLIVAEPGRIRVEAADCPDQICVQQGWLSEESAFPIVCLPHGLVIQIESAAP